MPRRVLSGSQEDEVTALNRVFAAELNAFEADLRAQTIEQIERDSLALRLRYNELTKRERVELRGLEWRIKQLAREDRDAEDLRADPTMLSKKARRRREKTVARRAAVRTELHARQLRRRAMSPAERLSEEDAYMTALAVEVCNRAARVEAKNARRRARWEAEIEDELLDRPAPSRALSWTPPEASVPITPKRSSAPLVGDEPGQAPKEPPRPKRPRFYTTTNHLKD